MIQAFYSARQGLTSYQEQMNTISNNLANVNTVGYKAMRLSFTDLMYQNINRAEAENVALVGHGVKVNKSDLLMEQGGLDTTNRALDFALTRDNVFFALQDANGNITYTRAGNFIMSAEDGDTFYLAAANGDRVLDLDGNEIELEFDENGDLDFDPSVIGVYQFSNAYGLLATGNNRYVETPQSGPAEALDEDASTGLVVGFLENSSVETANEMVKVIEASRAFSFNSRMIQVADEVEQTVNSLR